MNEESYLACVIEILHQKIQEIDGKMAGNEKDIAQMHTYFWENYTEFDEYGYEQYDNSNALKSRVKEQGEYRRERFRYERMLDSPYFGRVDFCYEGESEPETYYIGIGNLARGRAKDPYVFDWRAPVSGLFYDYDKGAAQFQAPMGVLTGEITRKKQYKIKHGKIVYILENEINIDDEILQQALLEHADARLKSIVTTIQKEQNGIIRYPGQQILAVQGCAGSGKTSVALHRVAYLLYHNRKQLHAAQILILSPNSIFADYISRILPELGEENICEMTLDDFAYHELSAYGEAEDRYDEIEKLLHPKDALKPATQESLYNQSQAYMQELDGFILSLEWDLVDVQAFAYGKVELSERQISDLFYEKLADVPILSRMEKIGEYLIDAIETLRGKNMEEEERQTVFGRLNAMYQTRDVLELYQRFLAESGRKAMDTSDGILRYEDVYPLLYLKYAVLEPPKRREVKHLVIDEMQDYSYLQYVLLDQMFDCPMTMLGDKVQTMGSVQQDVLSFLPRIFGRRVHCAYLDKSYRSTIEIMEFANRLVGGQNVQAVKRHGRPPAVAYVRTEEEMYRRMARDIEQESEADTLAALCLDEGSARRAAEKLRQEMAGQNVMLLTRESMKFQQGLSVMPFYLAKGLEFDAVFVPDLQNYREPLHRQALYINATRALHSLHLYGIGEEPS